MRRIAVVGDVVPVVVVVVAVVVVVLVLVVVVLLPLSSPPDPHPHHHLLLPPPKLKTEETPYSGGVFHVKLILSQDFPSSPPRGFFLTKIYHPNVSSNGDICVNTLKKDWNAEVTLIHILQVSGGSRRSGRRKVGMVVIGSVVLL